MKKITLFVAAALAFITAPTYADAVQITLDVGQLLTSGSSPMADGYLLQVIADTSSNPGAPTASSFTGTDPNEVIVTSTEMNSTDIDPSVAGDTAINVSFTLGTTGTPKGTGSFLFLRWYPTLLSSAPNPGVNSPEYGQFTSSTKEYPSDAADIAWVIPAAGTYDMYFLTQSQDSLGPGTPNNPPPNSDGLADMTVAVPEPATLSLMAGAMALGATALRRRK